MGKALVIVGKELICQYLLLAFGIELQVVGDRELQKVQKLSPQLRSVKIKVILLVNNRLKTFSLV